MVEKQFLQLSKKWALAHDRNQWIVQRRKAPGRKGGEYRWANVAFVGSCKDVLLRVLREKRAEIEPHAQAYIEAMPGTFREWIAMPSARQFGAGHGAISGVRVGDSPPTPGQRPDRARKAA